MTTEPVPDGVDSTGGAPVATFRVSTREALLQFPGRIQRARAELWGLRHQVERLQLERKLQESKIAILVAREVVVVEGKEKPRHSNQDARDNETRNRVAGDPAFGALAEQTDDARRRIDAIEASVECWVAMMRNARVLELAAANPAALFDLGDDGI